MPAFSKSSTLLCAGLAFLVSNLTVGASDTPGAEQFRKKIQPILVEYCYDCHGDGANKGNIAFDDFKTEADLFNKRDLWLHALKNVRAGLMPPPKKPQPSPEAVQTLEAFIKSEIFDIDPANPDPGKVTIRRLNRNEYRNSIRDLTGYDYKVEEELPPDDTGYGFDNIGDVLTMSPLLMEKYMQAAETITAASVPRKSLMVREKSVVENRGRNNPNSRKTFYEPAKFSNSYKVEHAGSYLIEFDLEVFGEFNFDPGETKVTFKAGDTELSSQTLGWQSYKLHTFSFEDRFEKGTVPLTLEMQPLTPKEKKKNSLDLRLAGLRVVGPLEKDHWVRPKNFDRYFTQDPPEDPKARREYAGQVLKRFAEKAYRRPVDDRTVDRLAKLAEDIYTSPGKRFEDGVAGTMTPILASPRFLFRIEAGEPAVDSKNHPMLDEYSLASRLSYFLWSTMPDEELFKLASKKELRKNLQAQVKRMMEDHRSDAFMQNFVGQWLQVRDVDGIDINARAVLSRDGGQGEDPEFQKKRIRRDQLNDIPEDKQTAEQKAELAKIRQELGRGRRAPIAELDGALRRALREETEKTFAYVARENRSVVELIKADYTFLNERLAKHYGITNVTGQEMRLVKLAEDSPRGGILTEGATLIVTSNPTRTSPVKRGLFVLDNILGMPPPPPPPDVPNLEESEKPVGDRRPTTREILEVHREKPLCSSCHNRMDPLGFALENFNAMGMWRDKERGEKIDAAGSLVTGETFNDIREVKEVLSTKYRIHFYRCLTEKLLTYALGRGLDYYDVETVDQIVDKLSREDGKFSALLAGIIDSPAFQKRRNPSFQETLPPSKPSDTRASIDP